MIAPLKTMFVTHPFGITGSQWQFNRHMGVDLRAAVGVPLYAPEDGIINERYVGSKGILVLGLAGTKWHRFLHLDSFAVPLNAQVKAGQLIGYTGNTGQVAAHLHWDVRKPNTLWSSSFSNYFDPMILLKEEDDMKPAPYETANIYAQVLLFRDMGRPEWEKYHKDKTRDQLFDAFANAQERKDWIAKNVNPPSGEAQKKLASAKTKAQDIIDL